ncbi:MAG: prephenate dehydrogenase [Clostridia bacterium]|nr:prephenate dehydrogenase [Clostridia bacterium]MBQ2693490.1 prephenate dehydrogenase [Clostridia bacterium]MBQ5480458.1 prephenate dehydrogenase [Clostridia bacterium]MBQ6526195.1 prephenate dehydrogenase [Clostridia bacterium]
MKPIHTVGIVGLGLIGGSMARSVKKHTIATVYGHDISPEAMALATESGAIDAPLTRETLQECDLLLIAIAPRSLVKWVEDHADAIPTTTILVDLCGVKRYIYKHIAPIAREKGFLYVGGHPMAGKEVSGFANSDRELYRDASMILCPDETADDESIDTLKAFFLSLGFGEIVFSTPEEHDRIIAYTSQLAHAASSAYIKSPTSRQRMGFTAGSYKDMTRVARLDPEMWTQLFMVNRDHMIDELQELVDNLTGYLDALKADDPAQLKKLLEEGRDLKVTEPIENC